MNKALMLLALVLAILLHVLVKCNKEEKKPAEDETLTVSAAVPMG